MRLEFRRRGVRSALLRALAAHIAARGLTEVRSRVDGPESMAFADHFGFVERDRQIEQVRAIGDEQSPSALPDGVDVMRLDEQPELWAACFDTFGKEALADFALYTPLEISAEQ